MSFFDEWAASSFRGVIRLAAHMPGVVSLRERTDYFDGRGWFREGWRMKRVLEVVWAYVSFALMLVGIAGLSWNMFKQGGWLGTFVGKVWEAESHNFMAVAFIVGGTFAAAWFFLRGGLAAAGRGHPLAEAIIYAIMASGAYFTVMWWLG